jgi:hypothetical protein
MEGVAAVLFFLIHLGNKLKVVLKFGKKGTSGQPENSKPPKTNSQVDTYVFNLFNI